MKPLRSARGMLLLEVMGYVFVVALIFGAIAGSSSLLCHNLQQSARTEQQLTEWTEVSELLRDDIRGAVRVEWLLMKNKAGTEETALRLTQAGGRTIEYRVERKLEQVLQAPPPSKASPRRIIPPDTDKKPAPVVVASNPIVVISPPVLIRSAGDSKALKQTHRFEWYDLVSVEHSTPAGGVWELAEMKAGESIDAAAARMFFMLNIAYLAPHKPARLYATGAATRLDTGAQR